MSEANRDSNVDGDEIDGYTIAKQRFQQTSKSGPIEIGENVEVTGGDRLYAGVVVDIVSDEEYKIKYFEFDAVVTLPVSSLVRIPSQEGQFDPYEVSEGMQCQCKYAADGQIYDCVINTVTKYGYQVTYTLYGTSEEVPIEYLRPLPESDVITDDEGEAVAVTSSSAPKKDKKGEDGLIVIPESLKILPTDTEEVKNRKRKKIKLIKNKNRIATLENEHKEVQQTWQKFVAKGTKRALTGLNKNSMFTTTDLAIDGKLGVQHSGKGMTTFDNTRKKHKFDLSAV